MKVLIVSHTVISRSSNMGKTLRSYFFDFALGEIAQFYIHSEIPTDDSICSNYYRFTDKDALKSIVSFRRHGKVFNGKDIDKTRISARTDTGVVGSVYQYGRKRTGSIYLARNMLWKLSRWFTKDLKAWLDSFQPDVVFFASGDYAFMYEIAKRISEYVNKPLVVSCVDDYYLQNKNANSLIGRLEYMARMRSVRTTIARASCILTICDTMRDQYSKLFCKQCYTLHTSASNIDIGLLTEANQLSYVGNLGFDRYLQLIHIGKELHHIDPNRYIDVYSGEKRTEILSLLKQADGIRYHGQISPDAVYDVMRKSMIVIHTESFEKHIQDKIRFSVSTKIAESLMYGPCLLAYGPEGIASIDYLKENDAAYVITSKEQLESGLKEIIENAELRERIVNNARQLAEKNHSLDVNSKKVRKWLEKAVEEYNR